MHFSHENTHRGAKASISPEHLPLRRFVDSHTENGIKRHNGLPFLSFSTTASPTFLVACSLQWY
jgi:hypothetical protein